MDILLYKSENTPENTFLGHKNNIKRFDVQKKKH